MRRSLKERKLCWMIFLLSLLSSFFFSPLVGLIPSVFGAPEDAPTISGASPSDGATNIYTNPALSVYVVDPNTHPMQIIFESDAAGDWEVIQSYIGVGDGTYSCVPTEMNELGTL